jgi:hypothetical protein
LTLKFINKAGRCLPGDLSELKKKYHSLSVRVSKHLKGIQHHEGLDKFPERYQLQFAKIIWVTKTHLTI